MVEWSNHISKQYIFTARYHQDYDGQMLVRDVERSDGELFREHLYIPFTHRFKRLRLRRGDSLRLRAKVNVYYKKHPADRHLPRHKARLIQKFQLTNIHVLGVERCD